MVKSTRWSGGLLVVMVLLASACGARVSDEQIRAAQGVPVVGSPGESPSTGEGATAVGADATDEAPTPGTGGSNAEAATAGDRGPAAVAPGGNGGATDVGVTGDTVVLGSVVTISGPVPGLYGGATTGAQAAIAYQNSKGGLFGRRFKLDVRDDQFDTGQNRAATVELLGKVFAFLGSFSLYDDAAAKEIAASGIPDVTHAIARGRQEIANNFAATPFQSGVAPTTQFVYFRDKLGDAVTGVGTLYGDLPVLKSLHEDQKAAAESVGWKFGYERAFNPTETDFTADVVRMRQSGVKLVYLFLMDEKNQARFVSAMARQNFDVPVVAGYNPNLPALAGAAAEGVMAYSATALFDGADLQIPEVKLFYDWTQRVKPGSRPDIYAVLSWISGRLLFEAMEKAGPRATRADVITQLRKFTEYTANGFIAPSGPGTKQPQQCALFTEVKDGKWIRVAPREGFLCLGPLHRRK